MNGRRSKAPTKSALSSGNKRLRKSALDVQSAGRASDKTLVHVNRREKAQMDRMFGPASINPHTGLPEHGFFSKLKKTAKFMQKHTRKVLKGAYDGVRGKGSIFGGTPLGTKLSNAVTGRHDKPIADQYGGPTPEEKEKYKDEHGKDSLGFSSELHQVGSTIGSFYAGQGIGNGIENLAAGAGASTGVASAAGNLGSKAAMTYAGQENAKAMGESAGRTPSALSKKKATSLLLTRAGEIADREYTPYTGDRVAGISDNERRASELARQGNPDTQRLYDKSESAIDDSMQEFNKENLDPYLSPYRDSGIERENELYDANRASLLNSKAGAWGGDRAAFAESELTRQHMGAISDINAKAYDQATNAFFNDASRKQNAAQAYQSVGGDISQLNRQQIQDLMATGSIERVLNQANLDFDFQQFVENRDWDITNLEPLLRALGTTGQPGANPKGDNTAAAIGAAATIAGAYFSAGGGGGGADGSAGGGYTDAAVSAGVT